MHPLILLALSAMVAAAPQSLPANATNVTDDLTLIGSSSEQAGRNYTKDEVHANVLQHYPRERIINSSSINQYIADNFGANHTIYVSDLEEWIPMSSVRKGNNSTQSLDKRTGGPNPCQYYYTTTWTEQTGQWPGAWYPVSSCSYNGLDSEEASTEINWSSSYSIQESAGLSWDIIESVLSASLSVSVTETWTSGGSYQCGIPGNSVGQIWAQNIIGWGWFWSKECGDCSGCGSPYVDGGATAPLASTQLGVGVNLGCSAGYNNVNCNVA